MYVILQDASALKPNLKDASENETQEKMHHQNAAFIGY